MKKIILLALAIFAGATAANAADVYSAKDSRGVLPEIYKVGQASFAGGFVGASLNWNTLDVKHSGSIDWSECKHNIACPLDDYFDADGGIAGALPDIDGKAISGGIRAGYMWQVGRIYGGPVVMADFGQVEANLSHDFTGPDGGDLDANPDLYATGKLSVGSNWRAAAVLKGGVEVIERVGVYGFAGVGAVDISVDGSISGPVVAGFTGNANPVNIMDYNETVIAFTYGFGVDVKLTDNLTAFGEWQRFDLDSFGGSKGVDCFAFTHDGDATLDAIKVGLNYQF